MLLVVLMVLVVVVAMVMVVIIPHEYSCKQAQPNPRHFSVTSALTSSISFMSFFSF